MASSGNERRSGRRAGVALVELALVTPLILVLLFAMVDFGRALLAQHEITSLSREGANLESRGTPLSGTLTAVLAASGSYDLGTHGFVILTAIERDVDDNLFIRDQASAGGQPATSRVGMAGGGSVTLPSGAGSLPLQGQTLYVSEVFLSFTPVTPIGSLIGASLPSTLYDVALFY